MRPASSLRFTLMPDRNPRRVHLDFTGCRLNQAEIEQMGRAFAARGDSLTASPEDADLVVINTCAVTLEATRKSRKLIWQAGRANLQARIVATGCLAQLEPDQLSKLPNVTQVIGNADKDQLVALVGGDEPEYDREPLLRGALPPGTLGRTRAFVKAQDGCDNRCTFCVTTLARGAGRSRPLDDIVAEIDLLQAMGYQEEVLTGVHLGSYGHDLGNPEGLRHLVAALLERTSIPRLRLSSLEPWDLTPAFFDLWDDPRLCPHLHLPLQSGCNATLRRMARRTTTESFADLMAAAVGRAVGSVVGGLSAGASGAAARRAVGVGAGRDAGGVRLVGVHAQLPAGCGGLAGDDRQHYHGGAAGRAGGG